MLTKNNQSKSCEKILGIWIDTKWLMENSRRIEKETLAKYIKDRYNEIYSRRIEVAKY